MLLAPLLVALSVGAQSVAADTIRLEVGSALVNGLVHGPHAARVRVWAGPGEGRVRTEWTNVLTLGDSAGRRVQRWVTRGTQVMPNGDTARWELRQTYDAKTLAPYGIARTTTAGLATSFRIDGKHVTGTRRMTRDGPVEAVDFMVERPGFVASASDLVPLAVGLKAGTVMTAPMWGPQMQASELRVFVVLGKVDVNVEGKVVNAWKVEERRHADAKLLATWYLVDKSPYMVYGEVPLDDGSIQRYTEVEIAPPSGEGR